jgi:RecB family exonuclease
MAKIEGEIVIGRPEDVVFDMVADQRNEPTYNPAMTRSEKLTPLMAWLGRRQERRIWTGLKQLLEGASAPPAHPS